MALRDRTDTQIWKAGGSSSGFEEGRARGCPLERRLARARSDALGGRQTSQCAGFERLFDRLLLEHLLHGPGDRHRRRFCRRERHNGARRRVFAFVAVLTVCALLVTF
jgi:hypothetical protein